MMDTLLLPLWLVLGNLDLVVIALLAAFIASAIRKAFTGEDVSPPRW